jgi:hypothetical protein
MRVLRRGRGDSKIGCLFWLLALGLAAYVGYQAVPAQLKAGDLKKFMTGLAEHKAEEPIERLQASILARVEDLGLPVDKKAVQVQRAGGRIIMSYRYKVPINLLVTRYEWPIEVKVDRLIVIT